MTAIYQQKDYSLSVGRANRQGGVAAPRGIFGHLETASHLRDSDIKSQKISDVRVRDLWPLRDFDRLGAHATHSPDYIEELRGHIKKHGILSPIFINYNPEMQVAYIAEGNHRLEIARELGLERVPVRVLVTSRDPSPTGLGGCRLEEADLDGVEDLELVHASRLGFETTPTQARE